jgi:DNA-binding transcriptional regulator YiaG
MATRANQDAAAKKPSDTGPARSQKRGPALPSIAKIRSAYSLTGPILARMLGVAEVTLAKWEEGKEQPTTDQVTKIKRVANLLKGLSQVMHLSYIPTWLEKPSAACADRGAGTPVDLMERGDYEAIEDMIFFFGSGVPF